jgi:hypothetical protein
VTRGFQNALHPRATSAARFVLSFAFFAIQVVSQEDFEQSRLSLSFLLVLIRYCQSNGFFTDALFSTPDSTRQNAHNFAQIA